MQQTDTTVSNLVINTLTKAQFDTIEQPSETELWLVEEDELALFAKDAEVVHKAGKETIEGEKTFTGAVVLNDATTVTQDKTDSSTKIATTEYVQTIIQELQATIQELQGRIETLEATNAKLAKVSTFINNEMPSYLKYINDESEVYVVRSKIIHTHEFKDNATLKKIYIPKDVVTIEGSTWEESPFLNCSAELQIYAEVDAKQDGWGEAWNMKDEVNSFQVHYNTTIEDFYALGQSQNII